MKKKVFRFFTVLGAWVCLLALVGCNGGEVEQTKKLAIDPDFKFENAELGESYSPAVGSVDVLGEGGEELTVSVKDNTLTRPDGTTFKLVGGKFTPDQVGDYKLTLAVDGHDEIDPVEKTIVCKDTKGPVVKPVEGQELPASALIGQSIQLPQVGGTDPSGLADEVKVQVIQPDGKEGTLSEDKKSFTASVAGSHTFTVTMKDKAGNEGKYTQFFTVYNTRYDKNTLAYFSSEYGKEQANAWVYHEGYMSEEYIEDVTKVQNGAGEEIPEAPSGVSGATCLTAVTGNKMLYYIELPVNDLTLWDYAGMWIYNDSAYPLFPYIVDDSVNGKACNQSVIPARSWFYLTLNLRLHFQLDQMIGVGDPNLADNNDVRYLSIAFRQLLPESNGNGVVDAYTTGDKIYLTDMKLDNFTEDGPIAEFDKPWGAAHITQFMGDRDQYIRGFDRTVKEDDDADAEGSTSFTVRKAVGAINAKIYGLNAKREDVLGKTFKMWVKNGSDHAVTVSDGNYSQTIAANKAEYVHVKVGDTGRKAEGENAGYGVWNFKISGDLAAGDTFYIGALTPEEKVVANAENALTSYEGVGSEAFTQAYINVSRVLTTDANAAEEHFYGNENMSAKIEVKGPASHMYVWFDVDKTDWSEYDYVKFYVWNGTDTGFELQTVDHGKDGEGNLCTQNDSSETEPNLIKPIIGKEGWVPVVIPLYKSDMVIPSCKGGRVDGNYHVDYNFYTLDNVESIGLWLSGKYNTGAVWISTITGGKYAEKADEENDLLISLNGDINPFRSASSGSANSVLYTATTDARYADADDRVGSKTTMKVQFTGTWQWPIRISGKYFRQDMRTEGAKGKIWVYNASPESVTVTPYNGNGVAIEANKGAYVEMPIRLGVSGSYDFQLSFARTAGGNLQAGDVLYFGNVYKVS